MRDAGLADDLPCVIVSKATTSQQQIRYTTVSGLAQEEKLPAPALLIVGRVATQDVERLGTAYWQEASPPHEIAQSQIPKWKVS
jgi:siroheme synthase